jgi:hypothetical protein
MSALAVHPDFGPMKLANNAVGLVQAGARKCVLGSRMLRRPVRPNAPDVAALLPARVHESALVTLIRSSDSARYAVIFTQARSIAPHIGKIVLVADSRLGEGHALHPQPNERIDRAQDGIQDQLPSELPRRQAPK